MTDTQLLKKMDQNSGLEIRFSMRQKGGSILQVSKGKKGIDSTMKKAKQKEKLDLS